MQIKLHGQIDINHWTVECLDGQWAGKIGDFRIETQNLERGQILEVEADAKCKPPPHTHYSGLLVVKKTVTTAAKMVAPKKKKVEQEELPMYRPRKD